MIYVKRIFPVNVIRVSKGYEPLIKICTLKTEHDIGMFLNL